MPKNYKRYEVDLIDRYMIPKGDSYNQFIKFCQLARWTQWCGDHSIPKKLHWNYGFGLYSRFDGREEDIVLTLKSMHAWFNSYLWTIAQPTVQKAWMRNVRKRTMKRELQEMLKSIEKTWLAHSTQLDNMRGVCKYARSGYSHSAHAALCEDWAAKVATVREIIDSW